MKVSVVIGSYNQKERLEKVLEGFQKQNFKQGFEVVIVDSMSPDGTKDMVDMLQSRGVSFELQFIQRENPAGKAEARNVGVSHAKGEYIIITDADMIPEEGFVTAHYQAHKDANKVCCFEGLAYNLDSYSWPPEAQELNTQVPKKYTNKQRLDWYYFLTGNLSFPKSIFILEKGFSEDFKSYGWEDLELGYRLKKRQVPLYYLTNAINYHFHVISDQERADRKLNMGQSAQIFIKKHPELRLFLGLNPVSVWLRKRISKGGLVWRMALACCQSKVKKVRQFGYWFVGEHNYLTGLLNLG